jgi:hypothetical protein
MVLLELEVAGFIAVVAVVEAVVILAEGLVIMNVRS